MAEQVERSEDRVLLTTLTAIDDQAVLEGRTVAIIFDVLENDTSTATGSLYISSITQQPAHGTVQIIPGNPSATGPASRDRISYVGSPLFTGADGFQYEAIDSDSNTDLANVSILVLSAATDEFSESSTGQIELANGLGGTGYEADPTTGFNPTIAGNFEYEVVQTGPWELPIGLGTDEDAEGTGDQTMTQTVTVTSDGNGNGTYRETIVWDYGLGAGDLNADPGTPGADQNKIWGRVTTILDVTMLNGTTTTTFTFDSLDNFDGSVTTTITESDSGAYYTDHSWGMYSYLMTITHTRHSNGDEEGSQSEFSTRTNGLDRDGTYSYDLAGGGVAGTYTISMSSSETYSYSIGWADNSVTGWNGIGMSSESGFGNTSSSYSGSGSYGDANFLGDITEGGGQNSYYSYSTNGTFNSTTG